MFTPHFWSGFYLWHTKMFSFVFIRPCLMANAPRRWRSHLFTAPHHPALIHLHFYTYTSTFQEHPNKASWFKSHFWRQFVVLWFAHRNLLYLTPINSITILHYGNNGFSYRLPIRNGDQSIWHPVFFTIFYSQRHFLSELFQVKLQVAVRYFLWTVSHIRWWLSLKFYMFNTCMH